MADDLAVTKSQRTVARRTVTATITKAKTLLANIPRNALELKKIRANLKAKFITLKELDVKILAALIDDDEIDQEITQCESNYYEKVIDCEVEIDEALKELNASLVPPPAATVTNNYNGNGHVPHETTMRLPKYEAIKFKGNPLEWDDFWGNFDISIDTKTNITNKSKLVYLKSFLEGEAALVLKGLPPTDENYPVAKELLLERFGRSDVIMSAHLNSLMRMTPVRDIMDTESLQKLYDRCESNVRGLRAAKMNADAIDATVCPLILGLVPKQISLDFSRQYPDGKYKAKELLDMIRAELIHHSKIDNFQELHRKKEVEKSEKSEKSGKSEKSEEKTMRKSHDRVPSARVLSTTISNCMFCSKTHDRDSCTSTAAERKNYIVKNGRCFKCLKKGHTSKTCSYRITCKLCQRSHNPLICDGTPKTVTENVITHVATCVDLSKFVPPPAATLATIFVRVMHQSTEAIVQCLLDPGSQTTFVLSSLAKDMKLPSTGTENLSVLTFGSQTSQNVKRGRFDLKLCHVDDKNKALTVSAFETPWITRPIKTELQAGLRAALERNNIVINFEQHNNFDIFCLIGADNIARILTGRIEKLEENLVAVETMFGWTVMGTSPNVTSLSTMVTRVFNVRLDDRLEEGLRKFWELEAIGIRHETVDESPTDRNSCTKRFREQVTREDGRYVVPLPWLVDTSQLNNNYEVAKRRFWHLVRKFKKNPGFYQAYKKIFEDQLKNDIIEEVEIQDPEHSYFMPHRAVVREDRATTKIRIVFDASSKGKNELSLNDCLDSGPNLLPEILKLLVLFRRELVAYLSDIEKAFLQLLLRLCDRNFVSFLWVPENWDGLEFVVPRIMRQKRVTFGVSSSPYSLNDTIQMHLDEMEKLYPETVKQIREKFYVDDLIDSMRTDDQVLTVFFEARKLMMDAHLPLRKWHSNSRRLREIFAKEIPEDEEIIAAENEQTTVLGLIWNYETDRLQLEIGEWAEKKPEDGQGTKRAIVQAVAKIYDPLGFAAPFTIVGKLMFQELWMRKIDWDVPLPPDIAKRWCEWIKQVTTLRRISVKRPYSSNLSDDSQQELHFFCDASPKAYGVVVYVRTETKGTVDVSLCMSKSRVAPLKPLTLPKLELMSALLSSRIAEKLQVLEVQKMHYWTDSSITYFWIREQQGKTNPFVANRVREIRTNTDVESWRHCPGRVNPADKLTRGMEAVKLVEDGEWWNGPKWLHKSKEHWPQGIDTEMETQLEEVEENSTRINVTRASERLEPLFALETYSSWTKVVRITAWMLRFVRNSKKDQSIGGPLKTEEIEAAETYWFRHTQRSRFAEEMESVQNAVKLNRESPLSQVELIVDENKILRINSRIRDHIGTKNFIYPIVLDADSPMTTLIIRDCHRRALHGGLGDTLSEFRSKFWTRRARKTIKNYVSKCITCRRVNSKLMTQAIGLLPSDRINRAAPFQVIGVDFAGPLYMRSGDKCYIALFTCAVVRAVHLELVSDLSTEKFILAFKRLISRRGIPSVVYSDNAKTFKRAEKDLALFINGFASEKFQGFLSHNKIQWKFIVELAPWWGGFWERLVKTVKLSLKKVLGRASLCFEELTTVLTEVEAIINSRPITYVTDNPTEPEPLSPSHFLIGARLSSLPDVYDPEHRADLNKRAELVKRWKLRQRMTNLLWRRWSHEYLVELREFRRVKASREIEVNELVLVQEQGQPRMAWKTAKITKTFNGRDGKVRSCEMMLPSGKVMRRPVQRLCALEIHEEN